ncbi:MAG TPA: fused MFS/spermidine synthase [Terriglobales bacterium]
MATSGNELALGIMLGLWLILTAGGSHFLGRLLSRISPHKLFPLLLIAEALALFAALFALRVSRVYWHASPGEVLGPLPVFVIAFITLIVFCPISGTLFAVGSRLYGDNVSGDVARAGTSMYLLEAVGSALGGALVSIILIRLTGSLQIAVLVAVANTLCAVWIVTTKVLLRWTVSLAVIAAAALLALETKRIESATVARVWRGFRVIATETSRYGDLAVIENEGSRTLIQNGLPLFTSPDRASAEEAVHFPMLEHPAPKSILLIGGGINGSLAEILKHPTVERVDYVELDPAVLRMARQNFPEAQKLLSQPRAHLHEKDGRLFVKETGQQFDVIILNLPEPQTAQINRFYTVEFFRQVSSRLKRDGVFGFQMHASEEYLSPQSAEFLRCLNATLHEVFPNVITIPGEIIHFVASQDAASLSTDPQILLQRLQLRGIRTVYVSGYYLPHRMSRERVDALDQQLRPSRETRINRDSEPAAYFFDIELWSTQFSERYRTVFHSLSSIRFSVLLTVVGLGVVLITSACARSSADKGLRWTTGSAVALMGWTMMSAEVLLLVGFQSVYGYVFSELAVIVAGFMTGIAAGSWLAWRTSDATDTRLLRLLTVQIGATLLLVITPLLIGALGRSSAAVFVHVGFVTLAVCTGLVGGYQFPLGLKLFATGSAAPGTLYALDLLGASAGALIISAYLVPIFGFMRTAELTALANLCPILMIGTLIRRDAVKASSS